MAYYLFFFFLQPGAVNTTEIDFKKLKRYKKPTTLSNVDVNTIIPVQCFQKLKVDNFSIESLRKDITFLQLQHNQRNMNLLKIVDTLVLKRISILHNLI